jgi:hypothetical protein
MIEQKENRLGTVSKLWLVVFSVLYQKLNFGYALYEQPKKRIGFTH